MSVRYSYSTDEERYHGDYESHDEAAVAALDEIEGDMGVGDVLSVFTAQAVRKYASEFFQFDGDDLCEGATEAAAEATGECSEFWLCKVSPEARSALEQKLRAAVDQWATEYGHQPKFWCVEGEIEHEIQRTGEGSFLVDGDEVFS